MAIIITMRKYGWRLRLGNKCTYALQEIFWVKFLPKKRLNQILVEPVISYACET